MISSTVAALLGALIGAFAGIAGQIITASYTSHNERRRLAIECGFREWDALRQVAASSGGGKVFPPVLFVHFNYELMKLIDGGLTEEKYKALVARSDAVRDAIAKLQPKATQGQK